MTANISDKRKEARHRLAMQPTGQMFLRNQAARDPVRLIMDVSRSGVSVILGRPVDVSSPATIEYMDKGVRLEVYGTIAWCAPFDKTADDISSDGEFALGIQLMSPLLLLTFLNP